MDVNIDQLVAAVNDTWETSILECLRQYIRIPNKSPAFDADWEAHGYMEAAMDLVTEWCRAHCLPGMTLEVRRLPGRTPLLVIDVPGEGPGCTLLYGHLDKQPEFSGWEAGLGPWEPVLRDGRLYGRGGADDGYAAFSSLTAIAALKAQGIRLPRCVLLIEASEESGSIDLPAHLEALGDRIGEPDLIVCLDSECGDYDRVWSTTSLRGNLTGRLSIQVLREGVHSGMASGIAPSPFRILGQLLDRIEDPQTGTLLLEALQVTVPKERTEQMAVAARILGKAVAGKLPWAAHAHAVSEAPEELIANSTWRATLTVTGADGLPPVATAGNVLLPEISVKLSIRTPPTCNASLAADALKATLERDPPYAAQVRFEVDHPTSGWNAPALAPWLGAAIEHASTVVYGQTAAYTGCGGTIPFMAMLGERFPNAQFFITGVLGPHSNAHGPNEFLDIAYAKKLTACVSLVLADQAAAVRRV